MYDIISPASPSRMKELAFEEKEQEISKEIKNIVTLQIKEIKNAMKEGKKYCYWIAFVGLKPNCQITRFYSIEAEKEARRIFTEAGYKTTKNKIEWEI